MTTVRRETGTRHIDGQRREPPARARPGPHVRQAPSNRRRHAWTTASGRSAGRLARARSRVASTRRRAARSGSDPAAQGSQRRGRAGPSSPRIRTKRKISALTTSARTNDVGAGDADGEHPEPEEEKEHERPEKRLNALVDGRRTQVHDDATLQTRPRRQCGLAALHATHSAKPPTPQTHPKARAPKARLRSTRAKVRSTLPGNETASRRELFHSPSRSRFRPPHPLTFGFRLQPPGEASI